MTAAANLCSEIGIGRIGAVAQRVIGQSHKGHVAAVFTHSFYVEAAGRLCCICTADLSPGPLNAITVTPARTEWPAVGIRFGDPVRFHGGRLMVAGRFAFFCANALCWSPPQPTQRASLNTVATVLDDLARLAAPRLPKDGLGGFIVAFHPAGFGGAIARLADPPVMHLSSWLRRALDGGPGAQPDDLRSIEPLVGLGPGLTPSGDDFLAGAMITLDALGHQTALSHLGAAVSAMAARATGPISAAHLYAATTGQGHMAIHDLLLALLAGESDRLPHCLDAVARIGHTSGWDALAGIVLVLRAHIRVAEDECRAA